MQTINNKPVSTSVAIKAQVSERNFFKKLGGLFASDKSVLGEMMQNARRAGASKILIEADASQSFVAFNDDGEGIQDFSVLVTLCESGWEDEEVIVRDRAYGMGFFSSFFSAGEVVIYSRGQMLRATLEDIVERRELKVQPINLETAVPHLAGQGIQTRIELRNAKPGVIQPVTGGDCNASFIYEVRRVAKGFSLPVFVNGVEIERPHAQSALAGAHTSVGFVSVAGIHRPGYLSELTLRSQSMFAMYLQGLPIHTSGHATSDDPSYILHLDSVSFDARMPDRDVLRNEREGFERLSAVVRQMVGQWLVETKIRLTPSEFVLRHYNHCVMFGMAHLLNDIPFLPRRLFQYVQVVSADTDNDQVWTRADDTDGGMDLVSRADIQTGAFPVWIDAPDSADSSLYAALAMKVMQREGIHDISSRDFDVDHWIFDVAPLFDNLELQTVVHGAGEESRDYRWSNSSATIRLGDYAVVTVRNTAGEPYSLCSTVRDDWLLVPKREQGADDWGFVYDAYILGEDKGPDYPVASLDVFSDEYRHFNDELFQEAMNKWDDLVAGLTRQPLIELVNRHISNLYPTLQPHQACEVVGLRVLQDCDREGKYRPSGMQTFSLDSAFMAELSEHLTRLGHSVPPEQLAQAFAHAAKPGLTRANGPTPGAYLVDGELVKSS